MYLDFLGQQSENTERKEEKGMETEIGKRIDSCDSEWCEVPRRVCQYIVVGQVQRPKGQKSHQCKFYSNIVGLRTT